METQLKQLGNWGEQTAAEYLCRDSGMALLETQWQHEHGELDLILRQGKVMVFVEVRVRTNEANPLATYQSINRGKWRALRRTALAYLRQSRWRPCAVRFDMVGIRRHADGHLQDVMHWPNIGVFGKNFRF